MKKVQGLLSSMKVLGVLLLMMVVLTGCFQEEIKTSVNSKEGLSVKRTNVSLNDGAIEVFFSPYDDVDEKVISVLDEAQEEIVMAQYNIRSEAIINKIIEISKRGVVVKIAVDKKNALKDYNTGDDKLEDAGILVLRTKPEHKYALMHLKTTVIDSKTVMTGSFNYNETASYVNDENMLLIRDEKIAKHYKNQVLQILGETEVIVEESKLYSDIEVHFSPEEDLGRIIEAEIDKAQSSIKVAMFTFTHKYISKAILRAMYRGVDVKVIMEEKQLKYTITDEIYEEKEDILLVKAANKLAAHSAMHQKYVVIDNKKVITGAANWTISGTKRSDEDIIIINDESVATKYISNFNDLLYVYGGVDLGNETRTEVPVLIRVTNDQTSYGDKVVVTGNCEELGNWNPNNGLVLNTKGGMYPNWVGNKYLSNNKVVEFKIVVLKSNGQQIWEQGSNRVLEFNSNNAILFDTKFGETTNYEINYGNLSNIVEENVEFESDFENMFLRGTFNNWATEKMELVDNYTYKAEITFGNTENERFKVDIYGDWSYNFGDYNSDNILDVAGSDIIVNGNTSYVVTINEKDMSYSIEVK